MQELNVTDNRKDIRGHSYYEYIQRQEGQQGGGKPQEATGKRHIRDREV